MKVFIKGYRQKTESGTVIIDTVFVDVARVYFGCFGHLELYFYNGSRIVLTHTEAGIEGDFVEFEVM